MTNRHPDYVPGEAFAVLDKLSKADLMELVYDLAMIATGVADTATPQQVLAVIYASHTALRHNGFQGQVRLPAHTWLLE